MPTLTLFAGPNGSGKRTIVNYVRKNSQYSYPPDTVYLNADDLEQQLRKNPFCDLRVYGIQTTVRTRDADSNVARVKNLVTLGGHPVDDAKIRSRYAGSLDNLANALRLADEAYLFDNSTNGLTTGGIDNIEVNSIEVARKNGTDLSVTASEVPGWYITYVENKFLA